MRIRPMVTAFAVFTFLFTAVSSSATDKLSDEAKKRITDLQQQLDAMNLEGYDLSVARSSLMTEDRRLKDVAELLKGAFARHKSNLEGHNQSVAETEAAVDNHNARCPRSSSDQNLVAQCNAEAAQLNARHAQLNAEEELLRQTKRGLQERFQGLSKGTLEWTAKMKALNGKVEDLNGRSRAFLNRVNGVLEDLKVREKLSVNCAGMADLVSAHRCLQRVWDGAK